MKYTNTILRIFLWSNMAVMTYTFLLAATHNGEVLIQINTYGEQNFELTLLALFWALVMYSIKKNGILYTIGFRRLK